MIGFSAHVRKDGCKVNGVGDGNAVTADEMVAGTEGGASACEEGTTAVPAAPSGKGADAAGAVAC